MLFITHVRKLTRIFFSETLANFLIGEGKLESYLEENPPTEANIPKAKTGLADARKFLLMCIGEPAKKVRKHKSIGEVVSIKKNRTPIYST